MPKSRESTYDDCKLGCSGMAAQCTTHCNCQPQEGARPIAIGEILRRLAATALNEQFLSRDDAIPRNQLALIRDGAIVGAHIVSNALRMNLSVASLNTSNAFNSLSRATLFNCVRGTELEGYVTWAYGNHSSLIIDHQHIV